MKKKSDTFFTEDEKKSIEAAIKDAESRTSGEIVTVVVDRSDSYRDVDVTAGLVFAAITSVIPAEIVFAASESILRDIIPSMNWYARVPDGARFMTGLTVFIVLTVLMHFPLKYIIARLTFLKRMLISNKRIDTEVRERALLAFHEHGLGNTRDATGILFLISVMEKRVYVLADHGIYTQIRQDTLDSYASAVSRGIAQGKGGEALCNAIKDAGLNLEKYFPGRRDDKNELSDKVVTER